MNKILFDLFHAQPDISGKYHGGGECIKTIFEALVRKCSGEGVTVCFNDKNFLDDWVTDLVREYHIGVKIVRCEDDIYALLNSGEYDRCFSGLPCWIDRDKLYKPVHCVGTVHSVRSVECPSDKYSRLVKPSIKNAIRPLLKNLIAKRAWNKSKACLDSLDDVITSSAHSAYSISNLSEARRDITICYPPLKHLACDLMPISGLGFRKMILMVSCNRWEKNPVRGIKALLDLSNRGKLEDVDVVCCGLKGTPVGKIVEGNDRFIQLGYVEPGQLEWLYKRCDVFFYPTLNEGFGYPPVEAMRYGTTCVVSGVSAVPEVCGNAAYYVSPYNLLDMQSRILQALNEPIPESRVMDRFEEISAKQERDLDKVIDIILGVA